MVELEINGIAYNGFNDVRISRSLGSITGAFSMTFSDKFRDLGLPPVQAGQSCRIYKDGELVKTGIIDAVNPQVDGSRVTLSVSGRDNPDVADCSIDHPTGEWKNLKFDVVLASIIAPFGVAIDNRVTPDALGDAIPSVNYDQGTKVYELIRKYAEKKQLLIYSGLDGRIIIDQASKEVVDLALVEGGNILKASGSIDYSNVFSRYIVKGDRASTPQDSSEEETQAQSEYIDEKIGRNRPTIIVADGQVTNGNTDQYSTWVATTRLAQAESYSIEVQGWYPEINKLITINSPTLKLDNKQKLIAGVELIEDAEGDRTIFQLVPKNAFDPAPGASLEEDEELSLWGKQ